MRDLMPAQGGIMGAGSVVRGVLAALVIVGLARGTPINTARSNIK
jgi:hypothetical protein